MWESEMDWNMVLARNLSRGDMSAAWRNMVWYMDDALHRRLRLARFSVVYDLWFMGFMQKS